MGELHLELLGGLRIANDGVAVNGFVSRKAPALLCYLAVTSQQRDQADRCEPRHTASCSMGWADGCELRHTVVSCSMSWANRCEPRHSAASCSMGWVDGYEPRHTVVCGCRSQCPGVLTSA